MGTNIERVIGSWWIIMLVIILDTISKGCVEGLQSFDSKNFNPKPKGTIKTIEVLEDGDLIDCVDIYKQPAFNHPLINELKMAPSISFMKRLNTSINSHPSIIQNWRKYGECPEGTIPIRRNWNNNDTSHKKTLNSNSITHEYAIAYQNEDIYNGAGATFNLWNPYVDRPDEFSLSQIWIVSKRRQPLSTIEFGWIVYPMLFGDSNTRFFTYWTVDDYKNTGCYNLQCAGFVQTDRSFGLGGTLRVSKYGGQSNEITMNAARDWDTNHWWVQVNGKQIGYFPGSLFTNLRQGADILEFGGEIINSKSGNKHTTTQMGSGHFPPEGKGKASYVRNIKIVNEAFDVVDARDLGSKTTRPECYNSHIGPPDTDWKSHFFYGGPGLSDQCR